MAQPRLPVLVTLATLLVSSGGEAAPYDFVVIASSAGPFHDLQPSVPSLDANGAVAFVGETPGAGSFIRNVFVGSQFGCSIDDYVQISGLPGQPSFLGINGIGRVVPTQVAFGARSSTEIAAYRGSGGPLSAIYLDSGEPVIPDTIIDEPAVNSAGTLALIVFGATSADTKLQTANDEDVSTLLSVGDDLPNRQHISAIFETDPDIDELGHVAFDAQYLDPTGTQCDEEVLLTTGDAAVASVVAAGGFTSGCPFALAGTTPLALNAEGQVAFGGRFGLLLNNAVFLDETVVWNDQLEGFGDSPFPDAVAVNDGGLVAFELNSNNHHAVYLALGDDPVADKVLAPGDALCGSTVTDVGFHRFGLNDAGQLALFVTLADGRSLVVRADPSSGLGGQCETACGTTTWPAPEPEGQLTAAAFGLALVGLGRIRWSRGTEKASRAARAVE